MKTKSFPKYHVLRKDDGLTPILIMKRDLTSLLLRWLLLPALMINLHAGPRSSTNYTVATDTADAGGQRATSTNYRNDGSAGGVAGISTVGAPAETAKHGYLGQLYDVTGLVVSGASSVNETATLQLAAAQVLDDATTLAVAPSSVAWSVLSGPLSSISATGLATAGTVYQNTPATAQGIFLGNTGTLSLTVLDGIIDNYGSYAGDGLGDDWQVQYFGLNNPQAAPGYVSDGSGHTNLFKYAAGLIPNNSSSKFTVVINPVNGQPTQKNIVFTPSLADRTYIIQTGTTLSSWSTLSGPIAGNGSTQTVTDTSAGVPNKFYRVQITKP